MTDPNEVEVMRAEIDRLHREIGDCRNALLTSNEHGDLLQEHLCRLSTSLTAEVRERQAAEEKLRQLLQVTMREKGDLEVLVQILIDQGDSFAEEGEKALVDGLTKIPNRRRLDEHLQKEWARHARVQQSLSFLLCDVDHFKLYNDHYGHQAGDECLKAVAQAISQTLRADDLAARYGGEEFALVLPHTPHARAIELAEQVRLAIAALAIPHVASPVCGHVTVSVGTASRVPAIASRVAAFEDARDSGSLVEEADRNLYLAKAWGRNRVVHEDRAIPQEKGNSKS